MRKVVRSVGVVSVAKIAGLLYAAIGFVVGIVFAGIAMLGGFASLAQDQSLGVLGVFLGAGAIIIFPLMYGIFAAIFGMLAAFLYNLLAGAVGGLELEVE